MAFSSGAEIMYVDNSFMAWYIVTFKNWKKSCLYTEVAATVTGMYLAICRPSALHLLLPTWRVSLTGS